MIRHDQRNHAIEIPAATCERSTSIKSIAFGSDCRMRLAALVFVVAKITRSLLSIASELAFRAGFAIAGAKSPHHFRLLWHD
jgi:hypothetical protein